MTTKEIRNINRKTKREYLKLKADPKKLIREMSMKVAGGCWLWMGNRTRAGYGYVSYGGKNMRAHRLSYIAFKGKFDERLFVCHTCDYPTCVNPDHLFLGTCKQNTYDAIEKGRFHQIFEPGHKPVNRLTDDATAKKIKEMIAANNKGVTLKKISQMFNVSYNVVKDIKRGRSYINLK